MTNSPYRLLEYALHMAHANVDELMVDDMDDEYAAVDYLEEDYLLLAQLSAEDWMFILEAAREGLANEAVLDNMDLVDWAAAELRGRLGEILD